MCQIIPVKRESWESENKWLEKDSLKDVKKEREQMQKERIDWYKNNIHVKKQYT